MLQVLISDFSVQVKFASDSIVSDSRVIVSQLSVSQKVASELVLSEDTTIVESSSLSYSPYVTSGGTPTVIKDITTHTIETTYLK